MVRAFSTTLIVLYGSALGACIGDSIHNGTRANATYDYVGVSSTFVIHGTHPVSLTHSSDWWRNRRPCNGF